ncbi:MAG: DUF6056 family protein [Atopobiaceae bacterium]|nr:DUF6056 family protein [Atopobiaceae bacterium]MCI2173499.1 DUF6056 family protein [Atopobiaceae bacterium]MCI2207494.1 DUF6056 family protein [Atopobiaceae bacterium]
MTEEDRDHVEGAERTMTEADVPVTTPDAAPVTMPASPAVVVEAAPKRHRPNPLSFVAGGSLVALVATLAPLLAISAYDHSYADDWHYGVWAHLALASDGVWAAIATAFEQVGKAWFEWQGTYSAILLMALEPSVWGEQWYVLTAPIILGSLVAATFFFVHVCVVEYLHAGRATWLAVSSVVLVLQILLQPSPVEGIFWFNSAIYYTFYHSLMLVLAGMLMRTLDPSRTRPRTALDVGCALLGAFVAGGNYVTILVCVEVVSVLLVVLLVRHHPRATDVFPTFATLMIGTTLNMVAPGNSVRQQTQFSGDGAGVLGTIWQSSTSVFKYLGNWSSFLVIAGVLLLLPLAARAVSRRGAARWRWPVPGVVTIASIALLASSFTPTFWSMGTVGPGRVQNARFDLYVVLVVVNLFWWCGWTCRRRRELAGTSPSMVSFPASQTARVCGLVGLVTCLVFASMCADSTTSETLSSVSATNSLVSGKAAAYDEQVKTRLFALENSDASSLEVPFYTDAPKVLFMGDVRDNMDNYINYRLCQWYGKTSIIGYHGTTVQALPDETSSTTSDATQDGSSQ